MESIKNFINVLLDKKSRKAVYKIFEENDVCVCNHFYKDNVDESQLILLIKMSRWRHKLQNVLLDIIFCISEESFTDEVIKTCIKCRGNFKKTLLIQLSHIWLKEEQLEEIIKVINIPEAYCKLLLLKACNVNISDENLVSFINSNKQFLKKIGNFKDYLMNKNVTTDRIELIDKLL